MDNGKDKKIITSPYYSLDKLSEDSGLLKRGLRDLSLWPQVQDIFNKLNEKFCAGLTDESIELCLEILATDPNHFTTLWYYGRCLLEKGEYEKSIEYFTRCLNENEESSNFFILIFRGDAYWKLGDYKNALNDFLKAIDLDPSIGVSYVNVAICFSSMGEHDKAHEYIDQAISMDNKSDLPMGKKAEIFENQGKIAEALEQYKKTLKMFPDDEYAKKKVIELSK
ncbi:MAG: tetratricopeptide repeat protein [Candidatus Paceibacterota bacterium]|jgi:tetratricopeptide (TPR) repeat protein